MEFRAPLRRHRWQQRCLPFFFLSPISTSFFVIFVSCVFARDNKWSNDQIKSYSFYHTQTHTSRFGVWSTLCTFSNCANATHKCNLFGWTYATQRNLIVREIDHVFLLFRASNRERGRRLVGRGRRDSFGMVKWVQTGIGITHQSAQTNNNENPNKETQRYVQHKTHMEINRTHVGLRMNEFRRRRKNSRMSCANIFVNVKW